MRPNKLPVLDIATYYTNKAAFVEELRTACHTVGFFLIRHGMTPSSLADDMVQESRRFFQRPPLEKNKISYEQSPSFRGYMQMGVENTAGKLDHREQIEYAVEYPNNVSNNSHAWPAYERLKSPRNPWPSTFQPSLQPVTVEYARQVCQVADCIRDSLCLALQLDPKILADKFENTEDQVPHWVIKMISYPPSPAADEDHQGVGAHTDTNFLTLVLQDQIGGLQAFSKGEWLDVPTDYGSEVLVCNLGEQAEVWSRGYFLATPHRVLRNTSSENVNRISVPLFYNPVLSATMEPLEESLMSHVSWDRPNATSGHWRRDNNAMLASVGENTFKSLARSHPKVFAKHHPDLRILANGKIVRKDVETRLK
jgi:isopenicillin N synthase-like dioxygenase